MIMNFYDFGEIIENDTKFVIFGVPWDYLTSIDTPDSASAPKKIREVSSNLGYTTEMGIEIPSLKVTDLGDVNIKSNDVEENLNLIKEFLKDTYKQKEDIIPIMIGGDHFCTYPVIKTVGNQFEKKNQFGVLVFDAHLDLYQEWDKSIYSHATITNKIFDLDYITNKNLLIVGTRDIDIPELKFSQSKKIKYFNAHLLIKGLDNYINNIIEFYKKSNIKYLYVSIDIDAIDPSNAPGTGFAIPSGFTYREIWRILRELTLNFDIIAFDLVEVAPNLDSKNNMTCNLAAKLIVEFISFISDKLNL